MLVYEAGKAAVVGMTRQMANDFGPDNMRVNAIGPGHIVLEGLAELSRTPPRACISSPTSTCYAVPVLPMTSQALSRSCVQPPPRSSPVTR